jgi:hypothetical protein
MKTKEQIDAAVERLKENKEKCRPITGFGDNAHDALDAMIDTLENHLDEYDIERKYYNERDPYVEQAALEMLNWKDEDDDDIKDHLYPEPE